MTTATPTTSTTQCAGCGAKIPTTVSICPYCVTPQQNVAAQAADKANPVVERLTRMKEKPEYELGLAYRPMEGPHCREAIARGRRGMVLGAIGLIIAGGALARADDWRLVTIAQLVAGLGLVAVGLTFGLRALATRKRTLSKPLLIRPARVGERRSETEIRGADGITVYYFQLQFDDGSEGEFAYPGRGASDEPLATGATGVAYTRGPELLSFKRIRV